MKKMLLGAMLLIAISEAWAVNGYYCVAEMANGFLYDAKKREYDPAAFAPINKWVIRRPTPEDLSNLRLLKANAPPWVVLKQSEQVAAISCPIANNTSFDCGGFGNFRFFLDSGRYIFSWVGMFGVEASDTTNSMSPFIEIGRCTAF